MRRGIAKNVTLIVIFQYNSLVICLTGLIENILTTFTKSKKGTGIYEI